MGFCSPPEASSPPPGAPASPLWPPRWCPRTRPHQQVDTCPRSDSSPQTTSVRAERAPALGRQSLKNKGCALAKTDLLFPGLGCSSPWFLSFLSAAVKAGDVTESTAPPGLLRAPSLLTMAVILTRRGLAYRLSLPSHPSDVGVTESLLKSRSDQVTPQLQTPPYLLSQVLQPRT